MNVNEQYKTLLKKVLQDGIETKDRTGVGTLSIFGYQMRFKLMDGFPAISLRKTPFKSAIGEMIGFMRAYKNSHDFKLLERIQAMELMHASVPLTEYALYTPPQVTAQCAITGQAGLCRQIILID